MIRIVVSGLPTGKAAIVTAGQPKLADDQAAQDHNLQIADRKTNDGVRGERWWLNGMGRWTVKWFF